MVDVGKEIIEQIENHKKRNRWIIFLISVGVIVLILLIILGIRINFIINDELNIKLSPLDRNIITTYDKQNNITFEFINDNSFLCKSSCTYSFTDLSNNKVLEEGDLVLRSKSKVVKSYNLTPSNYGAGQEIFLFQVTCNNIKSVVCGTDGPERFKSSFVTLSYDLSEEERARVLKINDDLNSFLEILKIVDIKRQEINYLFERSNLKLKDTLFFDDLDLFNNDLLIIGDYFSDLFNKSKYMINLWDDDNYVPLSIILNDSSSNISLVYNKINYSEIKLFDLIDNYNSLAYDLNSLSDRFLVIDSLIEYYNLSNNTVALQEVINIKTEFVKLNYSYNNKNNDFTSFKNEISKLSIGLFEFTNISNINLLNLNYSYKLNYSYIDTNSSINFNSSVSINIKIKEPICCVFGSCKVCCTINTCKNDPSLYPILFVHGHAFNKKTSPEVSLNSFTKMQNRLQEEGIINAGQIDLQNLEEITPGEYGKSGNPISVRGSYYYLHYYDLGKYAISTQKSERIENYALRLSEIINILKERTGSDKVNIIAHSMGGLVAREYIRIFGDNSVSKVILIATPNNGISGRTNDLCDFLGSKKECEDMTEGSVFLKRLNNSKIQNAKVYTIAASGCLINKEDGDGVVKLRNVPLPYATNFVINGTCTDFFKVNLHDTILDPDKIPEVYDILKEVLKD